VRRTASSIRTEGRRRRAETRDTGEAKDQFELSSSRGAPASLNEVRGGVGLAQGENETAGSQTICGRELFGGTSLKGENRINSPHYTERIEKENRVKTLPLHFRRQ